MKLLGSRTHHVILGGVEVEPVRRVLAVLPAKFFVQPVVKTPAIGNRLSKTPHVGGHGAHVAEDIGVVGSEVEALVTADGKAGDGAVGAVGDGAVNAVHEGNDVPCEACLHGSVNLEDAFEGILEAGVGVVLVVVVLVYIGHYDDAFLSQSLFPEAVGGMVYFSKANQGGFVAAGSVQKVKDRVAFAGLVVVGRQVHNHAALRGAFYAGWIVVFFHQVLRAILSGTDGRTRKKALFVGKAYDSAGIERQ